MTALATPPRADRFAHQDGMIAFALERPGAVWDAGMSAGKTYCYLRVAELIDAQVVIALCPRAVLGVFPREARKAAERGGRAYITWNGAVQGARGPLASPTVAQRAAAIVEAHKHALVVKRPLLVCVNYDACYRGQMPDVLAGLANSGRTLLILDESHKIKAPGGRASWTAKRLGEAVRRNGGKVIAGTGTFAPQTPLDAYGQLRAVNPRLLGTNYQHVKTRYGRPKIAYTTRRPCPLCGAGLADPACSACRGEGTVKTDVPLLTPRGEPIYDGILEDRADEYARILAHAVYRVDQDTIDRNLGLADPVDVYRTIDLDPATRRVYSALERDQVAGVADGTIAAANAMVNALRLAQVASGYAPDADDPGVEHQLSNPPELARLLADVLDGIPASQPVVVFARFTNDLRHIERVAGELGRRYGELSGPRKDGLTADSEMSPDIDLLGCQIQSGGTGIDLTRACHGIYYSVDFDLADYLQSRRRLVREGQVHAVTFVHLIAENTIHRAIYGALRNKQTLTAAFLNYMKELSSP